MGFFGKSRKAVAVPQLVASPPPAARKRPGFVGIDIGCGGAKRPDFEGIDILSIPGVDHVLSLEEQNLPYADRSVDYVFSAHFLEHVKHIKRYLTEISRVIREDGQVETWTPYAFSNEAFVYGHEVFLTELPWLHVCVSHRGHYKKFTGTGLWSLHEVCYRVTQETLADLEKQGVPLSFALKYFKGVAEEFGVYCRVSHMPDAPIVEPVYTYCLERNGPHFQVETHAPYTAQWAIA